MSSSSGDTIEARTNRDLEKMIKEDERKMRQHVKVRPRLSFFRRIFSLLLL